MTLTFVRIRTTLASWVLALVGLGGTLFAGDLALPVPRLSPGDAQLRLFLPALLAAAIASFAAHPLLAAEVTSPRRTARLVALLMAAGAGLCTVALGFAAVFTRDVVFLASARNLLIYLGMGLAGVAALGGLGTAVPVVAAMLLAVVAWEGGSPVLAWVVSGEVSSASCVVSVMVATAGLLVSVRHPVTVLQRRGE